MMDVQERKDLEAGFASALQRIEAGDSNCTLIETSLGGFGINAVILVRGDLATFDVCQAVLKVMDGWDTKAAPEARLCAHCSSPLESTEPLCVHGVCPACHAAFFCVGCGQGHRA